MSLIMKEPSTWGGIGLIFAGVERFLQSPVTSNSWALLGASVCAGVAAIVLRESSGAMGAGQQSQTVTVVNAAVDGGGK